MFLHFLHFSLCFFIFFMFLHVLYLSSCFLNFFTLQHCGDKWRKVATKPRFLSMCHLCVYPIYEFMKLKLEKCHCVTYSIFNHVVSCNKLCSESASTHSLVQNLCLTIFCNIFSTKKLGKKTYPNIIAIVLKWATECFKSDGGENLYIQIYVLFEIKTWNFSISKWFETFYFLFLVWSNFFGFATVVFRWGSLFYCGTPGGRPSPQRLVAPPFVTVLH